MIEAHIDLSALRDNARRARELAPNSQLMAVIKANAYGHGMVAVARALQEFGMVNVDWAGGNTLYAQGECGVPPIVWDGIAAANGCLYVSTADGKVMALGRK